ncbi:DUF494 domain-containing protein [Methylomarinum sp. Ch1-1]|uniref:Protein Smg homolog n=1 Tax=Methylomarinum roseum TaxID=3067653 RepID=A0AAU7NUX5_9GAMM|nr:DUF494 domain-containing protein [Methylomarinum sp. Ch1-1]MDP4519096.1 DUF494 domain-containing protein [Methylomarinum sp. Ch1-1]
MKEDIFDVLIYLFENYLDNEIEMFGDADAIATELIDAGFEQPEVSKAFDWLESLTEESTITPAVSSAFRIFSDQEKAALDLECRNFLMFLEHSQILTPISREIVIDRAMALKNENINLDKLKWLVLMILLSQPDDVVAFSRMEDIVYGLIPASLH